VEPRVEKTASRNSAAPATVSDVESFIHEYYDAWGGTDLDRIMSYYAENVVLQIPGLRMEGKEAVRDQFVLPFTTAFPGNRHIVKKMVSGPGVVVIEFSFEAEHKGPFAGHAATGARVKLPGCGVYEYDSRKRQITAGRIYFDVGTLLQTIMDSLLDDRQKAEEALRTNEQNLSLIINVVPTFIHVLRTDGSVLYANQAVLDYHGCTLDDVRREDYRPRFFHPEDVEKLREERREALTRPVPFENEQRVLGKDGKYRWFMIRYNPLLDAQEKIDRWYAAAFDIEDRKKAEEALQSNERNLSLTLNSISTHIGVCGPDGTILSVNQAALDYHGITFEDVQKEDFASRWFHPDDIGRLTEELREALPRPQRFECEYRALGKDGKYRWFLVRYNPLLDDKGTIERWYVISFDIEDRKLVEDALARQAAVRADVSAAFSKPAHLGEILRGCTEAIVHHLDAAFARIWMVNKDGSMLELKASAGIYTRLDGSYSRIPVGDLKVGLIAREKKAHFTNDVLNDPRVNDKRWAQCNGMVAFAGYPLVVEDRLIGVVALFARHPLPESILNTLASVADTIAQGIERKRAEQAVREREREARLIVETIPGFVASLSPAGEVEFVNKGLIDYCGQGLEAMKQWGTNGTVHVDDLPHVVELFTRGITAGEPYEFDARIRRSDGTYRWFQVRGLPLRDMDGQIVRWYCLLVDVEDRKLAEQALQQAYAFLAEAQRLSKTGSWGWNASTGKVVWSEEHFRILGLDPLNTKPSLDVFWERVHPDDRVGLRDTFESAIRAKRDFEQEFRIITLDGSIRHLQGVGHAILNKANELVEFIGSAMDISERKRADGALQEARAELERVTRVTTMGELAASIAHEVNQPLAGIVTSANAGLNWLAAKPPNLSKTRETLERILRDGTRGGEVLARIRTLLKRTPPAMTLVGMNQIVRDVLALTAGELRQQGIALSVNLASHLPAISGDNIQLQQVLLNLIKNAIEAMTDIANGQRMLGITSRFGELDGKPAAVIEVSDTGVGFSASDSSRLFEAFHTTKSQGMGMGLWISRSIIENHHGRLSASSNDGRGATFVIMLPKASQEHG
jgi:PAS domain S-box-containing protein